MSKTTKIQVSVYNGYSANKACEALERIGYNIINCKGVPIAGDIWIEIDGEVDEESLPVDMQINHCINFNGEPLPITEKEKDLRVARKLQQTENAKHNIKYKKFTLHLYNPNRRYDILNNTHDKKEKAYCVECGYMRYIGTEEECINWINKNKF